MKHVVIVRGGALGDFILGLPLLDSLRVAYPGASMTLVGPRAWLPLAWRSDGSVRLVSIDDPAISAMYGGQPLPPRAVNVGRPESLPHADAPTTPTTEREPRHPKAGFDDKSAGTDLADAEPRKGFVPEGPLWTIAPNDVAPALDAVPRSADLVLLLFRSTDDALEAAWRASGARRVLWHTPLPDPDWVKPAADVALGALRALGLPTAVRQPSIEMDAASQESAAAWLQSLPASTETSPVRGGDLQNRGLSSSSLKHADRAVTFPNRSAGAPPATGYPPHRVQGHGGGQAPALRADKISEYVDDHGGELGAGGEDLAPMVAIHPGSGGRWKCWPVERYSRLASLLSRQLDARIILVGGPADEAILRLFRQALVGITFREATEWPLRQLAALLDCCGLFIGNDSGVAHLAAAVGCPTLALFGPTDDRVWAPRGPHVAILRGVHSNEAPPDPTPVTWWRKRPVEADLTVEEVYEAAVGMFAARFRGEHACHPRQRS